MAQPMVETGSHNWSSSADQVNDENIVIVHDSTIANLYYQAYHPAFIAAQLSMGLTHTFSQIVCPTIDEGVNQLTEPSAGINVYPNPAHNQLTVAFSNIKAKDAIYQVYNLMGQTVLSGTLKTTTSKIDLSSLSAGMYMLSVQAGNARYTEKFSCIK